MPKPPTRRLSRLEREAHRWTLRMLDDPDRHKPALEAWLAGDVRRRETYDRMQRKLDRLTGAARTLDLPRLDPAALPRPRTPMTAITAAALVAMGIAGWQITAPLRTPGTTELASDTSGVHVHALADRSVVTLDKDTRLRVAYTARTRHVTLVGGRARFSVSPNADRPFVVSAGGGTVIARGTVFDVVSTAPCELEVILLEGAVDVLSPCPAREARADTIRLAAGKRIAYAARSPADAGPHVAAAVDTGWAGGRRTFRGVPLASVLAETNRYALRPIVLADPRVGGEPIVAEFDVRETERAARQLALALGLSVDLNDPERIVLRRE